MKHLLLTTDDYYPRTGGVPAVSRYLCEGLAQKGYKVTVVTIKSVSYTHLTLPTKA